MIESNALNGIIEGVLEDVAQRSVPASMLKEKLATAPQLRDAYAALNKEGMSLIAEVKRSSPSKGDLAEISDPISLAKSYQDGGADLVSVLTEERKFKGRVSDLIGVRQSINLPVLRKDFIVTEFQVYESRILGSDLLLLIIAGLSKSQLIDFYQLATELGMSVLVEVHTISEAEVALDIGAKIIGVNCRNLKTLELDKNAFELILPKLPDSVVKIAESGITTRTEVEAVAELGANAVLVGETLVKSGNPVHTIKDLLNR
ncbi:MAG: indole-3-glycerol phosphate synthase TrpC [Candidatus Nanopelagicus sp.]|jgi:indole-3-glycerol phosphate synthase